MAWQPSINFEEELVDMHPNYGVAQGQLPYEDKMQQQFNPRPQSHYDYLQSRRKRNKELEEQHGPISSKSKEIRESLAMMQHIQQIANTKPLGENATMADLDDTSTIEKEVIAMMRHSGMTSFAQHFLSPPAAEKDEAYKTDIHIMHCGYRTFPFIMNPKYFEPRRAEGTSEPSDSLNSSSSNSSSHNSAESQQNTSASSQKLNDLNISRSSDCNSSFNEESYVDASNNKTDTECLLAYNSDYSSSLHEEYRAASNSNTDTESDLEIPYVPLQHISTCIKKKQRPKGKGRRSLPSKKLYRF